MRKLVLIAVALSVGLSGCATSSKELSATYISPLQYNIYDCAQITSEVMRIQSRVSELGGRLDQAASNDKAIMGVGVILFWPALFALGGTKQQEAEYSRLKGEFNALQQAAIAKKCPGIVSDAPPATTMPAPSSNPAPSVAPAAQAASAAQPI